MFRHSLHLVVGPIAVSSCEVMAIFETDEFHVAIVRADDNYCSFRSELL